MTESAAIEISGLSKQFPGAAAPALRRLDARILPGRLTGLVGPDGAGKTTLLRLIAGLLEPTSGTVTVLGRNTTDRSSGVLEFLSYMPQRFGLYEDLTVMENLDLYGDLHGVVGSVREAAVERLLAFTALGPFTERLAGKLSGGMKQKLGLACSLIHRPRVLLLDEPSVGVDPLSRRELWQMVFELVDDGIAVVWSTAYLDEAERCTEVLVLNEGSLLYDGRPEELTASMIGRTHLATVPVDARRKFAVDIMQDASVLDSVIQGSKVRIVAQTSATALTLDRSHSIEPTAPRFEDAFMSLLGGIPKDRVQKARQSGGGQILAMPDGEVVVEAAGLTKLFGSFAAVDRVSFQVRPGEVFGLLGPNGAGKSTTFKMLCGLLTPTSGQARVAGIDLLHSRAEARQRMGYMAQKFSLYGDLSVRQNLQFFGGTYGLSGRHLDKTVDSAIEQFQLDDFVSTNASALPLGFKQRLSMACATLHDPAILFLDEPTSGVDPITRREFWIRINALVERGVAIIVTTHFMDEAEYCDRVMLIFRGQAIASNTPDGIKQSARSERLPDPTLEAAFIELIERSRAGQVEAGSTR